MMCRQGGGAQTLDELDLDRFRALAHLVRLDLEADLLAIGEMADASRLQGADMDEHVLRAAGRCDKAEAFRGIEELHGTCLAHLLFPLVFTRTRHASAFRRQLVFGERKQSVLSPRSGLIPAPAGR